MLVLFGFWLESLWFSVCLWRSFFVEILKIRCPENNLEHSEKEVERLRVYTEINSIILRNRIFLTIQQRLQA